jgi:hypothetical protein
MTPEDEEFERISREIRRNAAEDDDIQDYKKPWVGLTDEEIKEGESKGELGYGFIQGALWAQDKLKEKNF